GIGDALLSCLLFDLACASRELGQCRSIDSGKLPAMPGPLHFEAAFGQAVRQARMEQRLEIRCIPLQAGELARLPATLLAVPRAIQCKAVAVKVGVRHARDWPCRLMSVFTPNHVAGRAVLVSAANPHARLHLGLHVLHRTAHSVAEGFKDPWVLS